MNVALFTNNSAVYNRQENNNQKPETAGSIAFISKPATLFKRNDEVAIAKTSAPSVETAGSIACTSGLNGQAQTSSAGSSLSVAA